MTGSPGLAADIETMAQAIAKHTGIRCVADPRQIVLPCIVVGPPVLRFTTNCGAEADVPVTLMAAGAWNLDALAQLAGMLRSLLTVPDLVPPSDADPIVANTPEGGQVPAYRVTYRTVLDV